jgi:hypothetical protein
MPKPKKTSMYLYPDDAQKVVAIRKALGLRSNTDAVRCALYAYRLPKQK